MKLGVRKLRIILLGLGTVGYGVYQHLLANQDLFEIVGIGVRDIAKYQHYKIPSDIISNNLAELITVDCDVVIELLGGINPSRQLITQALIQKRHVVTGNKAVIAEHGPQLTHLATEFGVKLLYSAAIAGAIPVIESLSNFKNSIQSVSAILNGTCNFILDRIRLGDTYHEAIIAAQNAGFAEADPTLDLNGTDSAQKLRILLRHIIIHNRRHCEFEPAGEVENITITGIENIDTDFVRNEATNNRIVRLIASCSLNETGIHAEIKPISLDITHPLANISDANNCVLITTHDHRQIKLTGKGAGRWPTSESVFGDLIEIYHQYQASQLGHKTATTDLQSKGVPYEALDTVSAL